MYRLDPGSEVPKSTRMARSYYEPRNRFVLNSKMDEQVFKVWLVLYLRGMSVPEAILKFNELTRKSNKAPSAKTVTNLFRRMGRYMFHTSFEPLLWETNGEALKKYLDQGLDAYQAHLDEIARKIIDTAQDAMSLDQFHALAGSEHTRKMGERITLEVRALQVTRQGENDPRAHVGLAYMRALTPGSLSRSRLDEKHIETMANFVLEKMLAFPIDENGNTQHYLEYIPEKRNLNRYGAFEKKYWATQGVWIDDWNKKQQQKRDRPTFGYIRTRAGDESYAELRSRLEAEGCDRIFEDTNAGPDMESWRGFCELLFESSEYATILLANHQDWQPFDKNWKDAHIALYKSPATIRFLDHEAQKAVAETP